MLDKATEAYKETIRLDPNYTNAILNLGSIYYNKGMLNKAKEAFKKGLESEEKNKKFHFNLGLVFKKEGNIREAEYHFKRSLELGYTNAKNSLDRLTAEKIKTRQIPKNQQQKNRKWWQFWKK